jgi:uncharacterized membrane protein
MSLSLAGSLAGDSVHNVTPSGENLHLTRFWQTRQAFSALDTWISHGILILLTPNLLYDKPDPRKIKIQFIDIWLKIITSISEVIIKKVENAFLCLNPKEV